MSAVNFITSLARKILARESKGITKIPTQMAAEAKAGEIAARLQDAGLPLNRADEFIKSEQDLVRILNMIESTPPVMREVPSGIRSTREAKVFDLEGKEIPKGSQIMGGKATETEAEIAARMNKENKESVARIKNQKMVKDAVENASPGFVKGDRKYNAQLVAEDLAEKRFNKDFYDLDQKQQTDIYGEALDGLDDSDKFAQGGRAGFKAGLGKKFLDLLKGKPKKRFDERRFREGPIDLDFLENIDKKDLEKFIRTRDTGGPGGYGMYDNFADMPAGLRAAELIKTIKGPRNEINYKAAELFLGKKLKGNETANELIQMLNRQEMRADGGRIGYDKGSKLTDFIDVQAEGTKSGKQQIEGAPEGITADRESINAIIKADIPISQKIDLLARYQYGKGRNKIERDGQEIFLDEGGAKSRDIGFGFNKDGEGIGGTLMYNMETGKPEFNFGIKKSFADGGRIGYFMGGANPKGLGLLREILNYMSKKGVKENKFQGVDLSGVDMLRLSNPKAFNKMLEDVRGKVNVREGIMGTDSIRAQQEALRAQRKGLTEKSLDVAKAMKRDEDRIAKKIAEDAEITIIPQVKKQLMEGMGMSEEAAEKAARNMAEAAQNIKPIDAPPKITDEGILQLENVLKNMETGGKKKRDLNADGGRIGFKDGMSRRTFLKLLGGLATIPIIGKIVKPIKLAKGVKNVPIIKTENVAGKPEWFDALVNKVIIEGDDVTKKFATAERQSIHQKTLDDGSVVRVTEDVDDGAVRVEYESETNVFGDTATMEYKKPLPDEGASNPAAEFSTAESGPVGRQTGPDDYDIDVDEVGGSSISDLDSDVSKLKEYATGKKLTMKEFIQSKKRRDRAYDISTDLEAQSDAVTRRQGDYDPSDYDDYAAGGIARMLGE